MKKISVIIILISFLGIIAIIANNRENQVNSVFKKRKIEISDNRNFQNIRENNHNKKEADKMEDIRIKLTFNNKEIIVRMNDNKAAKDFIELLPLKLDFRDYAGTEKVSDLPKKLSKDGAPYGSKPSAGSFAYYSPWGNLAVFYKDFQYSNGLIILGETEAGLENLKDIDGEVKVEILQ